MTLVGLTGSIASGKSTVARLFAELGATVLSADEVVFSLERRGGPAFQPIVDRFGESVVDRSGELDRQALARRVFADEKDRRCLEEIVHPLVHAELLAEIERLKARGDKVIVLEIPLLVEVNGRERYGLDAVVVVDAPEEVALERLVAMRHLDEETARRRLAALPPSAKRLQAADFIIVNTGTIDELAEMTRRAFSYVCSLDK